MTGSPIPEPWRPALEPVVASRPMRMLGGFLKSEEAAGKAIYPPAGTRLAALAPPPLPAVRVVVLGPET